MITKLYKKFIDKIIGEEFVPLHVLTVLPWYGYQIYNQSR